MRRYGWLLALFCLLSGGLAHTRAQAQQNAVVVPLEILNTKHIAVSVVINGTGRFRMVLDTGSPITFLSTAAAKRVGLITAAEAKTPALGGMRTFGSLKSLAVGGAKVSDLSVFVLDHPTIDLISQVAGRLDGIVGYSFFAHFRTTIDYQAKTLTLLPGDQEPEDVMQSLFARMMAERTAQRVLIPGGLWGIRVAPQAGGGVVVQSVRAGSAAAESGMLAGDQIVTVDGRWAETERDFYEAAALAKAGTVIPVEIRRGAETRRLMLRPRQGL